jgi:hypothetical protein
MYGAVSWSRMIPQNKFTEECYWSVLLTVLCGLSWFNKWQFLVLLTWSCVKWSSPLNEMLRNCRGLALLTLQDANRLTMPAGSRCWMRWMWYGYNPSVCSSFLETFLRETPRRAETLGVLVRGLPCTMSMFPPSSKLRCTWRSARPLALGRSFIFLASTLEQKWIQVDRRFVVEEIVADIIQQRQWQYCFKTAHKMHIFYSFYTFYVIHIVHIRILKILTNKCT